MSCPNHCPNPKRSKMFQICIFQIGILGNCPVADSVGKLGYESIVIPRLSFRPRLSGQP